MSAGTLYMVATPIGHLGDFSFRGVEVLKSAAVIACEDTRHTRRLLTHYGIDAPLTSLHAHSSAGVIERLLDRVAAGESVAYVTDAGTPGISDPGGLLAEQAHARELTVVPIPGPAAVARELTKLHEEVRRGTLAELATYYQHHPARGEVTVVVGSCTDATAGAEPASDADQAAMAATLKDSGSPSMVAKELSKRLGITRQAAYRLLTR